MQAETKFKIKVRTTLVKLYGPRLWIVKVQQRSLRGTPDFVFCIDGYFFALELKRHVDCIADPLQSYNMQKIIDAGGVALCVAPENFETMLELIKQKCPV